MKKQRDETLAKEYRDKIKKLEAREKAIRTQIKNLQREHQSKCKHSSTHRVGDIDTQAWMECVFCDKYAGPF